MIQFEPEAETIWQDYVRQVRKYLNASNTTDPEEILADLDEHMEQELGTISQPVSLPRLEDVLKRLGNPRQWVPEEDLSWWNRMILRLRTGPEDWRLAYLSLGILIFGTLLGPLGLFGSFCLSRAALVVSEENELQAKKWLIYPSLIIVYCVLAAPLLFWPVVPGALAVDIFGKGSPFYREPFFDHDGLGTILVACSAIAVGLTVWWIVLLLVARRWPDFPRVLFRPFADSWQTRRFGRVVVIAAIVAAVLTGLTVTLWISTL